MSEIELTDAIIRHALELQRLSAHEEAEAVAILRQLEDELRQLLATRQLSGAGRREIAELIKAAESAIEGRYAQVAGTVDTQGIVMLVAERTVEAMQLVEPTASAPSAERLTSLSREVLIDGSPAKAWWDKQAEDTAFKFASAVRRGVINGETQERIVARIAGREGFMEVSRRNARALVHSSIMTAANRARLETYRKNSKHIAGLRFLATLDSHTCVRCGALDGAQWNLDGEPIRGTKQPFEAPPLHFACRCVLSPIAKSLNDVFPGIDAAIDAASQRASKDGPIAGTTTFADFLKRQSPEFVANTLGKKRADMFLRGKLTLTDLVSGTGRPLTLDQLKAR